LPAIGSETLIKLLNMDYRARAAYIMRLFLEDFSEEELDHYTKSAYADNYDGAEYRAAQRVVRRHSRP
jgi:hypothetical protein